MSQNPNGFPAYPNQTGYPQGGMMPNQMGMNQGMMNAYGNTQMNAQMNPNFNQGFNHQMNQAHFANMRAGFPTTGYPNSSGFVNQQFPGQPNGSMVYPNQQPNQFHDPNQQMANPAMMNQNMPNVNQQSWNQSQQPQIQAQMNQNQPVSQAMSQPHAMPAAQNQMASTNQQAAPGNPRNVPNQAPVAQNQPVPPQEPSPPPNRPRNIFDELLESSEDIFARLIAKEEMIGCCDKDEIHVGVEHSVNKFIQKAQVVELFFNQRIAKQTRVCQQDVLMEEIKDLKAEIHRKQNWIEGIYAKAEKWQETTSFADKKLDVKQEGLHALESMSPASYRKK